MRKSKFLEFLIHFFFQIEIHDRIDRLGVWGSLNSKPDTQANDRRSLWKRPIETHSGIYLHTCINLCARNVHAQLRYPRAIMSAWCAHVRCTFSAVSLLFKRVPGERETSGGGKERGMSVRHSILHDTYFYACSFAPAYGRARATRIDEARSVV